MECNYASCTLVLDERACRVIGPRVDANNVLF